MQYPASGNSPQGIINWKNFRVSQQVEARWSRLETSAGVYSASALTSLDSIITFQRTNGASVYFGLYGTPTFYASAVAHPTYADNVTKGPWGDTGECAYPTSLAAVTNVVTMLINRYNKPGGAWYDAHFATLGKGIQYWETWNEPSTGAGGNGNTIGAGATGSGFWWGSTGELVDLCQTQYAAIKAADASITVTSPGFTGSTPNIVTFMTTAGPITARTGLQTSEALAFHPYTHNPYNVTYGTWTQDIVNGNLGIKTVNTMLAANGWTLPLWISEFGVDSTGVGTTITAWYAAPPSFRYTWYCRLLMYWAAEGVKCWHPWNWNEQSSVQGNSGNWHDDLTGVVLAYNDFAAKVSGKTIISGTYKQQGEVSLRFSDGTSWTV